MSISVDPTQSEILAIERAKPVCALRASLEDEVVLHDPTAAVRMAEDATALPKEDDPLDIDFAITYHDN